MYDGMDERLQSRCASQIPKEGVAYAATCVARWELAVTVKHSVLAFIICPWPRAAYTFSIGM